MEHRTSLASEGKSADNSFYQNGSSDLGFRVVRKILTK
jgi:hypothetical protein